MESNNKGNKGELQTRREFFKKTAKGILPMLGAFVAAPTVIMGTLSSCGCYDCEAVCQDDCFNTCSGSCSDTCYHSSTYRCSDCSSSCSGTSASSTCSSCANDCSSSCKDECLDSCENTCSTTCEGTCSSTCEGSATGKPTTGTIDGHEYVDLGLSVLWATCNIDANSPEEKGTEFPFVYPNWYSKDDNGKSWYRMFSSLDLKPDNTICGTYLDIARNKWGNYWRLPSKDEFSELWLNCDDELIQNVGIKITSRINGNSIILPFFGTESDILYDDYGIYWSGDTVIINNSDKEYLGAYGLIVYQDKYEDSGGFFDYTYTIAYISSLTLSYRISLFLIRPVIDRERGDVSSCNGTCTANCSNNCSYTCKNECKGSCKGSCGSDCTGGCKEGCSTECNTTCTSTCADSCYIDCTNGCSGGCSSACKGTCTGGCKGGCSGSCGSGCSGGCTSCTATCADSCKAQTSQGCSGCSNTCSTGCGRQCYWSCGGSCDKQCEGACITGCQGYNSGSCSGTCFGTCSTQCSSTCRSYCYSSCKNMGISGT